MPRHTYDGLAYVEEQDGEALLSARGDLARGLEALDASVARVLEDLGTLPLRGALRLRRTLGSVAQSKTNPMIIAMGKPTAKILSCGAARVTIPMPRFTRSNAAMVGNAISSPPTNILLAQATMSWRLFRLNPSTATGRV